MNYELIFRDALCDIRSKWELPSSGFLAGGSISNVIWNKISGNNAPVNDLDIYILDGVVKLSETEIKKKQNFIKNENFVYEDYSGISQCFRKTGYYVINNVSVDGIYNYINYSSDTEDPNIIIESFDINCCQVGYDIGNDKFYWTKSFENFLNTGELMLVNLCSPAHSAIRIVKKKKDLSANLKDLELDIIAYTLSGNRFLDTAKVRFKQRYADMFDKYSEDLSSRFELDRDEDVEQYLRDNLNVHDNIYCVKSKSVGINIDSSMKIGVNLSKDFLFWIRNIFNDKELEKTWFRIHHIFDTSLTIEEYLDCKPTHIELETLRNLINVAPNCVKNLKGMTLSNQLKLVNNLFSKYKDDLIVAISILENHKIDDKINLEDDMDLLLLELSVRKNIVDDSRGKVRRLLGIEPEYDTSVVSIEPYF